MANAVNGTTFEVDPISRIEGHMGVKVTVDGTGKIKEANAHGNLWRGFENFLVGRRVNDAITFTQRICGVCPVPHGMAATHAADSVMGISDGYATFDNTGGAKGIPKAGLLVRNMVLASEFLMSSITHFYHLAALSYIQGPNMPPWTPFFDDTQYHPALLNKKPVSGSLRALPSLNASGVPTDLWSAVIKQYVKALRIRRLIFEASALFAGRAPMMSMSIAGGTTNNFRSVDDFNAKCDTFANIMTEVGEFVIREYIPLVFALGALYPSFDSQATGSGFGAGVGNFLAYGGFPETGATGALKIAGGYKIDGNAVVPLLTQRSDLTTAKAAIALNLKEVITRSRYADSLNEFDGSGNTGKAYPGSVTRTEPLRTDATKYSWLKAPRFAGQPMEVGPFARMVINGMYTIDHSTLLLNAAGTTHVLSGSVVTGNASWPQRYSAMYLNGSGTGLDTNVIHPDLVAGLASSTNPTDAIGTQGALLTTVQNYLITLTGGLSTIDRLRARAIESFHTISWLLGVPTKTGTGTGIAFPNTGWVSELKALGTGGLPAFSVAVNPPATRTSGYGLVEAPRGALGHFVTADNGKIVSYQCVVPTTWNASPKDGGTDATVIPLDNSGLIKRGPMEQAMIGVAYNNDAKVAGIAGDRQSGVEVLRVAQSFDPCIACAIH